MSREEFDLCERLGGEPLAYGQKRLLALSVFQFICLVQQHQQRHFRRARPIAQFQIEFAERVSDIHHQDQAHERFPIRQIIVDVALPVGLRDLGCFCIAVSRQIDQPPAAAHVKQIQDLGASWRLADFGSLAAAGQPVQHARLSGV